MEKLCFLIITQRTGVFYQNLNPIKIITNSDFIDKIRELDLNIEIINIDELKIAGREIIY